MSLETSDKLGGFPYPKLGENNYGSWSGDMKAKLMEKRCWREAVVSSNRPSDPLEVAVLSAVAVV